MRPDVDVVVAVHDVRRDFPRAVRSALGGAVSEGPTTASRPRVAGPEAGRGARPVPWRERRPAAGPWSTTPGAPARRMPRPRVRVTVVAHNLEAAVVVGTLETAGLAPELEAGTVRVLELADAVPSPAGPFTLGIERAEARYVSILGSDDHLEPGALAAWFAVAEARGSAAVLAPMRLDSGRLVRSPVPRPFAGRAWVARLDPVRDRLATRSAPLGLLRRDVVDRLDLRLVPGLRTGEDIPFSARLWFSGQRLDLDRTAPTYVIGTDAAERVSVGPKPVEVELAAVRLLRDEPWVERLGAEERRALAVTVLRVHVLGAVTRRVARGDWAAPGDVRSTGQGARGQDARHQDQDQDQDRDRDRDQDLDAVVGESLPNPARADEVRWLAGLARDWTDLAAGALDPFARADRRVLDALLAGDVAGLVAAARARATAGRLEAILPARLRHVADREGTLRRYVRERMWW